MSTVSTPRLRFLTGTILVCILATLPLQADQTYPYNAIIKNSTMVRCGPDDSYYSCQRLAAGSKVEVHALTENGFLAIRPPRGSSSWVDAEDLQVSNQSVGRVIRSGTVSWIGSQFTQPEDHNWQIQLQQGDQLRLSGKQTMQIRRDLPSATYYRVSPPASEFRWIPAAAVTPRSTASSQAAGIRWTDSGVRPASATVPVKQAPLPSPAARGGWRNRHGQKVTRVAALDVNPATEELPGGAGQQIVLLDTQLSELMSGKSESWQIDAVRSSLQQLLNQELGHPLQQRVHILLERIDQYRRVQQGQPLGPGTRQPAETTIYDAAGWLMKVHTSSNRAPPYAILDNDGKVLEFVSPAPGLNLHRYLKKRVGVFGYQSYLPSLKTPHITVYRIVDLARHEKR